MSDQIQEQPRKEITAYEFIRIWRGDYKNAEAYNNFYVYDNYDTYVRFRNCDIIGKVAIISENLPSIRFENCLVERVLITTRSNIASIILSESSVVEHFLIKGVSEVKGISIHNSVIKNGVSVVENSKLESIGIDNASRGSSIYLNGESSIRSIVVKGKSQISGITIQMNSTIDMISISGESVMNDLRSDGNSELRKILLYDKSKCNYITIQSDSIISELFISGGVVLNSITISKSTVKKILMRWKVRLYRLTLEQIGVESEKLQIEGCTISKTKFDFNISYDIQIKGYMEEEMELPIRSKIYDLDLTGSSFHKDSLVQIADTDINSICFDSFINRGKVIFNGIQPIYNFKEYVLSGDWPKRNNENNFLFEEVKNDNSSFEIVNSDLGDTQFISCDIDDFHEFEFENSKMEDVFIAGTVLPEVKHINREYDSKPDRLSQQRLAASQFKKIFERQGDTVKANRFRAEELRIYQEQINPLRHFGTWLVLGLSNETSSFGQSIWRPIFWLLCGHYLLFMLAIGVNAFEWHETKELPYYFLYLANPIRAYIFSKGLDFIDRHTNACLVFLYDI